MPTASPEPAAANPAKCWNWFVPERVTVEFLLPMQLTRRPVVIESTLDSADVAGSEVVQEIVQHHDERRLFARVTTRLGPGLDLLEVGLQAPLLDPAQDRVAVHRLPREGLQHEHVERAVQEVAGCPGHASLH